MIRASCLCLILMLVPGLARADAALHQLFTLMGMDRQLEFVRTEALSSAEDTFQDLAGRGIDPNLRQHVQRVYDLARMQEQVLSVFAEDLSDADINAGLIFFGSATGARIVELEVAARRAFLDPEIEDAARSRWLDGEETMPWLSARIAEITQQNDLLDRNVEGTLNAYLRFYQGLEAGGALEMSEAEMLEFVWSQEDAVRSDMEGWLGAYHLMAYQPLSEKDVTSYVTFWKTPQGQNINKALFAGVYQMYEDASYASARLLALNVQVQDL